MDEYGEVLPPLKDEVKSLTPALDQIMEWENEVAEHPDGGVSLAPSAEVYFAAAKEVTLMLGNALSDAGSVYLMLDHVLGAVSA